jgi:H/ACA ribonucleoprotein complex non-core subunit NAF1
MEEQFRDKDSLQLGICDRVPEEVVCDNGDNDDHEEVRINHVSREIMHHGESAVADKENVFSTNEQTIVRFDDTSLSTGSSYIGSDDETKLMEEEVVEVYSSDTTTELDASRCDDEVKQQHLHEVSDEEDLGATSTDPPRSKHEMMYQELPVEPLCLEISPDATILEIGYIQSIVDDLVVIQSTILYHYVLDIDSILCFEDRTVLGRVFETFGPIRRPLYSVRLSALEHANQEWVLSKKKIYFVPDHSQFVQIQQLKQLKGCDASNQYDEELPEEEQEFSDDEKETDAKRKKTQSKKQ